MWCPCYMTSLCFRIFYFLLLSSVINVVTIPSDVTDVTVWPITSNPNYRVLKIEIWKNKSKENKMRKENKENKEKLSSQSLILTLWVVHIAISLIFIILFLSFW